MADPHAPFNMKGNAYRGVLEYIEKEAPGGLAGVLAKVSPSTRAFVEQGFIAGGWYDVVPVDEITRVAAERMAIGHEDICQRIGKWVYDRDSTGVYKAILLFASPDLLIKAIPYTTKRYFDFVTLGVVSVGEHHYRVQVSGVPRAVIQTYVGMATVFMLEALAGAGAKDVEQHMTTPRLGPSVNGQATMQFERELRWR